MYPQQTDPVAAQVKIQNLSVVKAWHSAKPFEQLWPTLHLLKNRKFVTGQPLKMLANCPNSRSRAFSGIGSAQAHEITFDPYQK